MSLQKGKGHSAADEDRVHPVEEALNDADFVRDLGSAEDEDETLIFHDDRRCLCCGNKAVSWLAVNRWQAP